MKKPITIIEAPLVSEQYWSGVSGMARALREAGLVERVGATLTTQLPEPDWKPVRDSATQILNPADVREYVLKIADAVQNDLTQNYFPVVVGGDCTILLGNLLAMRRSGHTNPGLFFIDGHADFYDGSTSPSGETADMDLALAVGRGPDVLTKFDDAKPLVEESNVVLFGFRDEALMKEAGGPDVRKAQITCFSEDDIRSRGWSNAIEQNIETILQRTEQFWIHVDLDVLADDVMPAVDYRMPGGLSYGELVSALQRLINTEKAAGLSIAIFNPTLDWDGSIAKQLVNVLATSLAPQTR